ncbi:MAG: DUF4296 domain-containing protein [Prolixibacteraceae bacterium]
MNKLILITILLILVSGCKRDPLPKHAIPRDQFVDILVDIHIAEGMSQDRLRLKIDSIESTSLYLSILDKNNVSTEQMELTTLYYSRHQRDYKKIYTDVLDKISILIEEENTKKELIVNIDSIPPEQIKGLKTIEK